MRKGTILEMAMRTAAKSEFLSIYLAPAILCLVSLLINMILIKGYPCIEEDGVSFIKVGLQIINGQGHSGVHPPFYSILTGISSFFIEDVEFGARMVSAIFGALAIFPIFIIARWAFGSKVAIICCILTIFYPKLSEYYPAALSESTYYFSFLSGLVISWYAITNNKFYLYIFSGLIWGISYLTRPEGFGLFALLILLLLFKFLTNRKKIFLVNIGLVILGFLLAATPYLISQKAATGRWSLGAKTGMNLRLGETVGRLGDWGEAYDKVYFTLSEDGTKLSHQYMVQNDEGTIAYVLSHPQELVRRYIVNLHLLNKYVIPGLFYPVILILFAAGLFFSNTSDLKQKSILFLPFIPYLAIPFFIVADRYFLPFIPIVLIWASKGIVEVSRWLIKLFENYTNKFTRHILRQDVLTILITAIVLSTFIPQTFRPFLRKDTQQTVYREIGTWMKRNLPQGSKLLSRKQRVPFYSGMEHVPLPFASWNLVLKFAKLNKTDYFLADQNVLENRPTMHFLFDENFDSDQIQRIKEFKDASKKRIYIYKILY